MPDSMIAGIALTDIKKEENCLIIERDNTNILDRRVGRHCELHGN